MSPRQVLAEHTSHELTEWQAFFLLEAADADREAERMRQQARVRS